MAKIIFKKISDKHIKSYKKQGYFAMDLHTHTKYSMDGVTTVQHAVKKAKKHSFGFAVTDHNQIGGALEAWKYRKQCFIIPGVEATAKEGTHTIFYFHKASDLKAFFNKEIKPFKHKNPYYCNRSTSELMDIGRNHYNCYVCSPHPFAPGKVGVQSIRITKKMIKNIQLVEALNGYNRRKNNLLGRNWADNINKGITAGTDAHLLWELGRTLTFAPGTTISEFFEHLLKKNAILMGHEENLLEEGLMAIEKEYLIVERAERKHRTLALLKNQFGRPIHDLEKKFLKHFHKEKKHSKLHQHYRMHH